MRSDETAPDSVAFGVAFGIAFGIAFAVVFGIAFGIAFAVALCIPGWEGPSPWSGEVPPHAANRRIKVMTGEVGMDVPWVASPL
ncbi:MAG: hypothetical protein Q8P18_02245 [Pseudomonadota bacterium]|nr:hypothetical protein [Pseudomonadota bacterium]